MESKIDAEFLRNVKLMISRSPEKEIPVIVTYEPYAAASNISSTLEDAGLKIANRFPEINSVAGKISAKSIEKLLKVPEVKKVDPDSKVYALEQ